MKQQYSTISCKLILARILLMKDILQNVLSELAVTISSKFEILLEQEFIVFLEI